MEYQRIHQLLDKYWECATSVEEERELRDFFTSGPIPSELLPYKAWFVSYEAETLSPLGPEFDNRVLRQIERKKWSDRRRFVRNGLALILLLSAVVAFIFWFFALLFPF